MRTATFLYGVALLFVPFSYALKPMLQLASITWVQPTLVLAFLVFVLFNAPIRDKRALCVVIYTFLSASVGYLFMAVSPDRGKSPVYIVYLEPIRICLLMIWFWVSVEFLSVKRAFVFRWLAISATFQLVIASYLYLALYDLAPVPDVVALYLEVYKLRQTVWVGDTPVYRMAGTFMESPPFGLFMFSCFVVFATWLTGRRDTGAQGKSERRWAKLGATVGLVGAVASLSDQIFLAVIVFGLCLYLTVSRSARKGIWARKLTEAALGSALLLSVATYALPHVVEKWAEATTTARGEIGTRGLAGRERMFHVRYGLQLLEENPLAAFTGIGPGRYGDYAEKTGQFPPDVPIQVTPVAWVVEFGMFGSALILSWLWNIARRAKQTYSTLAVGGCLGLIIANITQGGWLFEAWFLALAFLYCAVPEETPALALST